MDRRALLIRYETKEKHWRDLHLLAFVHDIHYLKDIKQLYTKAI